MKIDDLIEESLKDPEFAKEFQKEGVVLKRTLDRVDLEEDVKIGSVAKFYQNVYLV